jgi:hypothetical protein
MSARRTVNPGELAASVRARYARALRSPPPLWSFAAVVVLGELVLALAGVRSVALSAAAVIAPGWALAPLLPAALRRHGLAMVSAATTLGVAVTSVATITLARVGITLDAVSLRGALIVLVVIALPLWEPRLPRRRRAGAADALELLGLLGALTLGLVLALRVVGTGTPPGNDWAKYLLYAEQVRIHGALLIRNPFWMLGQPFRDDPGVPALYGSVLILARAQASTLIHGILVFAALEIATVYAFARAYWGRAAGVLAAALVAVVPASQDILGWYGLANLAALALLALLFSYLASFAARPARSAPASAERDVGLDRRASVGMAVTLIGLLGAHRLSGAIGLGMTGAVILACLLSTPRRRAAFACALRLLVIAVIAGGGVLADLYSREKTFGGSLPYSDYLATKVNLTLALRDVSPMLAVALAVALVLIAVRHRDDGALWAPLALLAISVLLAYAWKLQIANYYARMVFYVPIAAAPLVAAMAVRLRPRPLLAAAAAVGIALTAGSAYSEAAAIRAYYTFVTPASLRGLDALAAKLRPGEVVVTDRCWSFLATWLLHTRTLAALEPQDIEPAAELPFAREAQQILDASSVGEADARRLGVRYLIVDPICPGQRGAPLGPPRNARPLYESQRLAILALERPGRSRSRRHRALT